MSGHTFKVGDRVRHTTGGTFVVHGVVAHGVSGRSLYAVSDEENLTFWWFGAEYLSPLPLFEPVQRWMQLDEEGDLTWDTFGSPGHAGRWVKVVISPAEDQS